MSLIYREGWYVPARDQVAFNIIQREVNDLEHIYSFCKNFRTVVQAGGNVGIWPKRMAAKFDWVHTFEPDPDNFEALCKNIEDVENIAAYHAALGSQAGTGSMDHIDPSNIGAHQVQEGSDFDIVILDDFVLEDVDLVQLDIEGFEHFALMGGERTIDANSPVIVLELKGLGERYGHPDSDTFELLAGLGYKETSRIHRDVIFTRG